MKNKKSPLGFLKLAVIAVFILLIAGFGIKNLVLKKILYPQEYKSYVEKYAQEYNVDKNLVYSVIKCESNFNKDAVSRTGARGLMQISEMTGIWASDILKVENYSSDMLFEPEININFGCWYLKRLIDQFDDESTALAAYNAGSGNVSKWLLESEHSNDGVSLDYIPFRETENYVKKVEKARKIYEYLYSR